MGDCKSVFESFLRVFLRVFWRNRNRDDWRLEEIGFQSQIML